MLHKFTFILTLLGISAIMISGCAEDLRDLDGVVTYDFPSADVSGADTGTGGSSGTASATSRCDTSGTTTDSDPDLLVHYAFENNLNDIAGSGTTGSPYNLTNMSGIIKYTQGCAYGQSAYFDSTTGYLENTDFNSGNILTLNSGNFTISMWVRPDQVLSEWASVLSSKDTTNSNISGWGNSIQIDVDKSGGSNYMRWNTASPSGANTKITDSSAITDWSFITAVHHDNNTAEFYRNGVAVGSHSSFAGNWEKIKVGINRGGYVGNPYWPTVLGNTWKGYIDEVKVYGRALDLNEVNNLYTRNYP